jgi:hypothetical protein
MSPKRKTAVKRKRSPSPSYSPPPSPSPSPSPPRPRDSPKKTSKLDTEFGVQQQQRAKMKRELNKRLGLYMPPREKGIIFHDYPEDGPNGLPIYLAEFNRKNYKNPMEYELMKEDGLTFGGRRRSRSRKTKNSSITKRKRRSCTRKK